MCTQPIEKDGNVFACRVCDQCIATRRHGWVARAMMEKAENKYALCVALSYDNETEQNRNGAAMFQYVDVREFMQKLRDNVRAAGCVAPVRFICAGEQGDRNGRCHWHLILYSAVDLVALGGFSRFGKPVTGRENIVSAGKEKIRLHWEPWGRGFVTVQEPDQGGMNYVLSYCLKDQFTGEKSRGTMRESKSENFATGLFRMSKRPAIGEKFLYRKLAEWEAAGVCLPALKIKVPGFKGYYQPAGNARKVLLWGLAAVNQSIKWRTGANAPQFRALVASLESQSEKEILDVETLENEDEEGFEASLARRGRETAGLQARALLRRQCGNEIACDECLSLATDEELASFGINRFSAGGVYWFEKTDHAPVGSGQRKYVGKSNPLCRSRGSKASRLAFPASG